MSGICTFSGKEFDPLQPDPEKIDLIDIVAALPHIMRYNGHTIWPYSVATHSVCLYEYGLQNGHDTYNDLGWALMHDAAEIYFGDFPTPIKKAVPLLREIDSRVRIAVAVRFGLSLEEPEWLVDADKRIILDERNVLFPAIPWPWTAVEHLDPLGVEIPTWNVDEAREAYLQRCNMVFNG